MFLGRQWPAYIISEFDLSSDVCSSDLMNKKFYLVAFFAMSLIGLSVNSSCSKSRGSSGTTSDTTSILNCPQTCNVSDLSGDFQWDVVSISGNQIQPVGEGAFIAFDNVNSKINGNTGCNIINANYVTIDSIPMSLAIQPGQVTMMACPDGQIEQLFLTALPTVETFAFVDSTSSCCASGDKANLVLKNKEGNTVMTLKKGAKKNAQ